MRYSPTLTSIFLLICFNSYLQFAGAQDDISSWAPVDSARSGFAVARFFDFGRYQQLFNKNYKSLVQEMARQKLFLARAATAFVSTINYMHRRADYYLGINEMSDQTPEELAEKINLSLSKRKRSLAANRGDRKEKGRIDAVDSEEFQKELREIIEHRGKEPDSEDAAAELERASKGPKKLGAGSRDLSIGELLSVTRAVDESSKIVSSVPSNNKDYEPIEVLSFGVEDDKREAEIPVDEAKQINSSTSTEFLKSVTSKLASAAKSFYQNVGGADKIEIGTKMANNQPKSDIVHVDHRRSRCFFRARGQGRCGSCYIFSSIALLEWVHCMQTGKLVAFSEQYIIDCGFRFGLNGCGGGFESDVGKFVSAYGLELRKHYPYRDQEGICPYPPNTDPRSMGYLKVNAGGFRKVKPERLESALERRPITVHVDVPPDFDFYRGGVHPGGRCDEQGTHAMLLVGSGRQDAQEYWLFRNSYNYTWGEAGYFKLNKKSRCIIEGEIWTADVDFENFVVQNERYIPHKFALHHNKQNPDAPKTKNSVV